VFDTAVNFCPCPHVAVLELFKNVNLPGSFGGIGFPTAPVPIVVEIVLSGAGLENSIPGYRPGKFVFEGAHFWIFLPLIKKP
jgi:hypothetical protein